MRILFKFTRRVGRAIRIGVKVRAVFFHHLASLGILPILKVKERPLVVPVKKQPAVVGEHIDGRDPPLPRLRILIIKYSRRAALPRHPLDIRLEVERFSFLFFGEIKSLRRRQHLGDQHVLIGHRQTPVIAQIVVDDDLIVHAGLCGYRRYVIAVGSLGSVATTRRVWFIRIRLQPAVLKHIAHPQAARPGRYREPEIFLKICLIMNGFLGLRKLSTQLFPKIEPIYRLPFRRRLAIVPDR